MEGWWKQYKIHNHRWMTAHFPSVFPPLAWDVQCDWSVKRHSSEIKALEAAWPQTKHWVRKCTERRQEAAERGCNLLLSLSIQSTVHRRTPDAVGWTDKGIWFSNGHPVPELESQNKWRYFKMTCYAVIHNYWLISPCLSVSKIAPTVLWMDFNDIFQEIEQENFNLSELKWTFGDVLGFQGDFDALIFQSHRPRNQRPRDFDHKPATLSCNRVSLLSLCIIFYSISGLITVCGGRQQLAGD